MRSREKNTGRYALITGATSGFGFEFSKLLASSGYNLVLVGRSLDRLRECADVLAHSYQIKNIILLSKDLLNPEAAKDIYRTTTDMGITIDVLINDAGKSEYGKFAEYDIDRDIDIIQLNITSLVSLTKFFLKDMVAKKSGKILQISSILGAYPTPLMSVYAASKIFLLAFTNGLINEFKNTNITIAALAPGLSENEFSGQMELREMRENALQKLPDPEVLSKAGFEALINGHSKIISGLNDETHNHFNFLW
jgi:short-subunit dehydrogenase